MPTKYEIPQEVVAEAIVNAVVHLDYASKASVQYILDLLLSIITVSLRTVEIVEALPELKFE